MKIELNSPKSWLAAPALAIAVACVLSAPPALAQTRAALVQSVDEPGRNPYQEHQHNSACRLRENCLIGFSQVPAGKRLVLTHINGHVNITNGSSPTVFVVQSGVDTPTSAYLAVTGVRASVSPVFGTRFFINQSVLAYFGPGEVPLIQFSVGEFADTMSGPAQLTLTGYFVNLP